MKENRVIATNVVEFLDKASSLVGKMLAEQWNQNIFCELLERGTESPIEDLFLIAVNAICQAAIVEVDPSPYELPDGSIDFGRGVFIMPQRCIGKYRVDFCIQQNKLCPDEIYTPVVVELDGHDFHDKDKRQRSYEKARDRFLVRSRYRVIHFTGSDVVADPFRVAHEALEMAGVLLGTGLEEYNPHDPLGLA